MERKESNLPFTSNVAEATVESQINVRFKCKRKCNGPEKAPGASSI